MKNVLGIAIALFAIVATPVAASAPASPGLPLTLVADVPLPGHVSRFDYQWVDPIHRRLYIAHLGDSSLVVFDLDGQRVLREVSGLPSVHGVVASPDQHLVLATATAEKTLALIDDQSFSVKARVPAGDYPNGLAYDPTTGKAFVSNNSGFGVGVVDVKTARAMPGIDIGGGAGNTQYDAESGHVLAAVHGGSFLADLDPATLRVASRLSLGDVKSCHGLLVESTLRLAFAACRNVAPLLVVVDLRTRRPMMTAPLPADIDVLAFDPGLHRLYAASETGMVVAFAVAADRSVTEMGRSVLAPSAHSVAVDPVTHRVYFPLEDVGGRPVLRIMQPPSDAKGAEARPGG